MIKTLKLRNAVIVLIGIFFVLGTITTGYTSQQTERELYREAESSYWEGDFSRAKELYSEVIDLASESEIVNDARLGLARAISRLGELEKAEGYFEQVKLEHPNRDVRGDAIFGLLEIAIITGQQDRAKDYYAEFIESHSDHMLYSAVVDEFTEFVEEPSRRRPQLPPGPTDDRPEEPDHRLTSLPELPGEPEEAEESPAVEDTPARPAPPAQPRRPRLPEIDEIDEPADLAEFLELALDDEPELKAQFMEQFEQLKNAEENYKELQRRLEEEQQARAELSHQLDEMVKHERLRDRVERHFEARFKELREENQELSSIIDDMTEDRADLLARLDDLEDSYLWLKNKNQELLVENQQLKERLSENIVEALKEFRLTELVEGVEIRDEARDAIIERRELQRDFVKQALEEDDLEEAMGRLEPLLENQPEADDYYLAASVYWQQTKQLKPALDYLQMAKELGDKERPRKLLLEAEILLEADEIQRFNQLIENHGDRLAERTEGELRARWYLLQGRKLLRQSNNDRAFFQLMRAVNVAPESHWADQARTLIRTEL